MSGEDFFVGYAATPARDRRFFLKAGLGLMAGTGALAAGLAALQRPPGPGNWDQADIRDWRGVVTSEPYPMLRTLDIDGTPRTALLACLGKCGVAARIGEVADGPAVIRGSLIRRGPHAMIAVVDDMDWIAADPSPEPVPALAFPSPEPIGDIRLKGEILDSKCWFGAMRPSEGKVHKACASLCIRGGVPPAFFARTGTGQGALMIVTDGGRAHGEAILPYVADPVSLTGALSRAGDLLYLDAPVTGVRRL